MTDATPHTTRLPIAATMLRRLTEVDNAPSVVQFLYPSLTIQTGQMPEACPRMTAAEVLLMLQSAILDFVVEHGTPAEGKGALVRIKLYLRALIDDEATYQDALKLADQL